MTIFKDMHGMPIILGDTVFYDGHYTVKQNRVKIYTSGSGRWQSSWRMELILIRPFTIRHDYSD